MITEAATEFREALPQGGRLAGLDVGSKTVGVALCDAGWTFATAAETVKRTKFSKDLERLKTIFAEQHIAGLIIGLPLNLDGTDSPQTQSTRAFARNVDQALDLPILLRDERWSTQAVERAMIEQDVTRKKRAARVDAAAAAFILQGAIDALVGL
ncbi:Holliday junction resolvase RuvX [Parasphingopyxis lamellibrachiae]|uniref:Putative pre-16S rRNA nuclease n=1 Tax=Parasphingopyxis lamellibrachiae TaxID=680125 RepID=A0A3D9FDT3_9SPHN|nr:Holliday junction resolvase RuvX [Parasphingopyxis lamellibrachiae]RED15828.1 putative Holliday junction resolvase [Parasphingopyxis lamellibrachiae]